MPAMASLQRRQPPHPSCCTAAPPALPAPMVTSPGHPVHARTVTVKAGDTLWGLARQYLGNGEKWHQLYRANRSTVGPDPDLIYPSERIIIP